MPKSKKHAARKPKASAKKVVKRAAAKPVAKTFSTKPSARAPPKTSNPEFQVKRTSYSKTIRSNVLSSAAARQRLIEMGGENTINIIRDFDKDMSDEELSRRTNIKASDVRVVLNRLHSQGLFSYTRVRDKDSGWYSYIWRMSEERLRNFADDIVESAAEQTVDSGGDRYRCLRCSPEEFVGFERAMDAQFRCEKCGNGLDFFERRKK